ncbi:MAG: membrane protein insertase YidC [Sphingomonadales bacterium]|nr:membrane protein insertase YidC [Sphingomonadales bacterium]
MKNQQNMIQMLLLMGLLLIGWDLAMQHFYPQTRHAASAPITAAPPVANTGPGTPDPESSTKPSREGGLVAPADIAAEDAALAGDLTPAGRVPIVAPGLSGSIDLTGAVIDDLVTNRHRTSVARDSGPERIFSPAGTPAQQFAQIGWVNGGAALPNAGTKWAAPAGAKLTPQTPVTLNWTNGTGQSFAETFAIDRDYMITVTETVTNHGTAPFAAQPFAFINRTDRTASVDSWTIHSGPFGAFDGKVQFSPKYKDVFKAGEIAPDGRTDWLGFTDIYWMSTLIPDKATPATGSFRALGGGLYRADLIYQPFILAPGESASRTTRLFAGAKEGTVLDRYEDAGIAHFGLAIDWGWFRWFEKPIFMLLRALFHATGNFGVAIILLTCLVRGVMFPVAQRQFASMAAMRAIQPKLKALQELHKDDRARLQEATMKLYKDEGVNPLAGCLPIFIQMPVFFGLYKVLMVSIEMRHQPFVLWIRDLSAPDPLHILNLFGLLPFEPPSILGIGILGLLLGITMFMQFRLQPPAADPAQQQVMAIMPWMMMFIMSPFAAGLLIYWITTNLLVIAQQTYLYAKHPQLRAQADKAAQDARRAAARNAK